MPLRRPLRSILFALALLGGLMLPRPGDAHPHVWITTMVSFLFQDGKLVALRQAWAFDDFFSASLIADFDKDKNGAFDEAEQRALAGKAFAALREYDYFTRIRQGGETFPIKDAETFSATLVNGLVFYGFTLPLGAALDPAKGPITAGVYDESFFVDVELDENDPVKFEGVPSGACKYAVREDPADAIYDGLVIPPSVTIECIKS
jgi:ABC-type uncharacterized transport system substrate-binding protein